MIAKLVIASFIGISSFAAVDTANAAPPSRDQVREVRQDARILGGVASGELTLRETARLAHQQAHIDAMQRRVRHDDGRVGPVERARLERAQDRASQDIYRMKHNGRTR